MEKAIAVEVQQSTYQVDKILANNPDNFKKRIAIGVDLSDIEQLRHNLAETNTCGDQKGDSSNHQDGGRRKSGKSQIINNSN